LILMTTEHLVIPGGGEAHCDDGERACFFGKSRIGECIGGSDHPCLANGSCVRRFPQSSLHPSAPLSTASRRVHQEKKIPCARRPPCVSWPAWRRRGPRGRRGDVLGQSNLRAHTTHGGCHPQSGTPRCRYSKSAHLDGVWHPRSGRSQSQHVTSTHEWQISIVQ
jgi:hypothetical protein